MTDCGPNQYIKLNLDTNPPTSECKDCYSLNELNVMASEVSPVANIQDEESLVEFFRRMSSESTDPILRERFGEHEINYRQCQDYQSYTTEGTAAIAKMEANSAMVTADTGTWEVLENVTGDVERLTTICEGGSVGDIDPTDIRICEIIDFYRRSDGYLGPDLIERQIRRQFGTANQVSTSGSIDFNLPNLPTEYGGGNTIQDYKRAIHSKRGYYITNNPTILEFLQTQNQFPLVPGQSDNTFTPPSEENIIMEEIYDFFIELNRLQPRRSSGIDGVDFQNLFSGGPTTTEFEICMNNIFDTRLFDKYKDTDIQERIKNITSLEQLQNKDIDYIEDKLKIISIMDEEDAMECMNIINLGQMVCETGVSEKMLKMGYLVFHIIGLDKIDLDNIQPGDQKYYKLTKILDRLTPYIRRAVKKIIKISKHYELKTCGHESTTTHILETIYNDVFEKTKEVDVHIDSLDFIPTYLIKDTNMMEFAKTIILLIVVIAGIYVLLMVLNRPLYPPSK